MAGPAHTEPDLVRDLVWANRILAHEGIVDGFGHVSVRSAAAQDRFLIARSMAPALVTSDDVLVCDIEGTVHDSAGRGSYLERFIHSEVYRARQDVAAVVHTHSAALIPFGVTRARLRPICHMCGFLAPQVPVFEIRDAAGTETDMLIRTQALGRAMAASLGNSAVLLLRGHGSVAVGSSLKQAVFRAVYAELNARLQSQAMGLGPIEYLGDAEARAASTANDTQLDRPWQLWQSKLAHAGLAP